MMPGAVRDAISTFIHAVLSHVDPATYHEAVDVNFSLNEVVVKFLSVAGLVKIRLAPPFSDIPPLSQKGEV